MTIIAFSFIIIQFFSFVIITVLGGRTGPTKGSVCRQPVEVGYCIKFVQRWAYFRGDCHPFHYSGCGGNDNNFESYSSCNDECSKNAQNSGIMPLFYNRLKYKNRNKTGDLANLKSGHIDKFLPLYVPSLIPRRYFKSKLFTLRMPYPKHRWHNKPGYINKRPHHILFPTVGPTTAKPVCHHYPETKQISRLKTTPIIKSNAFDYSKHKISALNTFLEDSVSFEISPDYSVIKSRPAFLRLVNFDNLSTRKSNSYNQRMKRFKIPNNYSKRLSKHSSSKQARSSNELKTEDSELMTSSNPFFLPELMYYHLQSKYLRKSKASNNKTQIVDDVRNSNSTNSTEKPIFIRRFTEYETETTAAKMLQKPLRLNIPRGPRLDKFLKNVRPLHDFKPHYIIPSHIYITAGKSLSHPQTNIPRTPKFRTASDTVGPMALAIHRGPHSKTTSNPTSKFHEHIHYILSSSKKKNTINNGHSDTVGPMRLVIHKGPYSKTIPNPTSKFHEHIHYTLSSSKKKNTVNDSKTNSSQNTLSSSKNKHSGLGSASFKPHSTQNKLSSGKKKLPALGFPSP